MLYRECTCLTIHKQMHHEKDQQNDEEYDLQKEQQKLWQQYVLIEVLLVWALEHVSDHWLYAMSLHMFGEKAWKLIVHVDCSLGILKQHRFHRFGGSRKLPKPSLNKLRKPWNIKTSTRYTPYPLIRNPWIRNESLESARKTGKNQPKTYSNLSEI